MKNGNRPLALGIECGGTQTTALLVDAAGRLISEHKAGPANLRLLKDAALRQIFAHLAARLAFPDALAIGMAGARTEEDRARIRAAAARVWPGVPCLATNDLETALAAAPGPDMARVLVLSGTGSCCFGRTPGGRTARFGGWGHILGDKGSGFEIGLRALKAVVYYFDRDGEWSRLGQRLLRALLLNEPDELIRWVQTASKTDIAALAIEVFAAWRERDAIAADILEGAAHSLARDGADCARKLVKAGTPVQFVLAGSVLLKQPRFARRVAGHLRKLWPQAMVKPLARPSAWGAVELARAQLSGKSVKGLSPQNKGAAVSLARSTVEDAPRAPLAVASSPTEQRNPRSMNLDQLSLDAAIELMLSEDARLPAAIRAEKKSIERAIRFIVASLKKGGRLFYVGAGTSGRLGVLDASECPPTFRTPPELVQGIIAGGQRALWEAAEGAEDDPGAGAQAVQFRGVDRRDTLVGIAASGRTPFVWGALREARWRGARTVLLCFNPKLAIARGDRPDLVIAPRIGSEIVTGSTRLKSGTATKLILNMFTTLAMVRLGKVMGNLMIDVKATNTKLRDRATRIVCELTGADYESARAALIKTDWQIKPACARVGRIFKRSK